MREVAEPFSSFGADIISQVWAEGSDSGLCLAIGLVMVSGSHVVIKLEIGHKLHPEAGGELGISIRNDRSGENVY